MSENEQETPCKENEENEQETPCKENEEKEQETPCKENEEKEQETPCKENEEKEKEEKVGVSKIALCFIISGKHVLAKEHIWRAWIDQNPGLFQVYFFYESLGKIKSPWIRRHAIPPAHLVRTSYYHMIPAYMSLLRYAYTHDANNKWFCLLTDTCCPIVSPQTVRARFAEYSDHSLFSWKPAWWNPHFHTRANLAKLPPEYRLGHDPWFVLTRENVRQALWFTQTQPKLVRLVSSGGLANESLFAILFRYYDEIGPTTTVIRSTNNPRILCTSSHIADWSRPSSMTSPHVFVRGDADDIRCIQQGIKQHPLAMFLRKLSPAFPDEVLRGFLYGEQRLS